MIFTKNLKFACDICVSGHRAKECYHFARIYSGMVFLVKDRGRPDRVTAEKLEREKKKRKGTGEPEPTLKSTRIRLTYASPNRILNARCGRNREVFQFECDARCCAKRFDGVFLDDNIKLELVVDGKDQGPPPPSELPRSSFHPKTNYFKNFGHGRQRVVDNRYLNAKVKARVEAKVKATNIMEGNAQNNVNGSINQSALNDAELELANNLLTRANNLTGDEFDDPLSFEVDGDLYTPGAHYDGNNNNVTYFNGTNQTVNDQMNYMNQMHYINQMNYMNQMKQRNNQMNIPVNRNRIIRAGGKVPPRNTGPDSRPNGTIISQNRRPNFQQSFPINQARQSVTQSMSFRPPPPPNYTGDNWGPGSSVGNNHNVHSGVRNNVYIGVNQNNTQTIINPNYLQTGNVDSLSNVMIYPQNGDFSLDINKNKLTYKTPVFSQEVSDISEDEDEDEDGEDDDDEDHEEEQQQDNNSVPKEDSLRSFVDNIIAANTLDHQINDQQVSMSESNEYSNQPIINDSMVGLMDPINPQPNQDLDANDYSERLNMNDDEFNKFLNESLATTLLEHMTQSELFNSSETQNQDNQESKQIFDQSSISQSQQSQQTFSYDINPDQSVFAGWKDLT